MNQAGTPEDSSGTPSPNPAALRGILEYVPLFRRQVLVIGIHGSLLEHDNFANLLLDVAVLRSLNIHVVLVFGIGSLIEREASTRGIAISDASGEGIADEATIRLAQSVAADATRRLIGELTRSGLKAAWPNAVRAVARGVVQGVDQQRSGRVEHVEVSWIRQMLDLEIVPVLSPVCWDRQGLSLRLSADHLAAEIAQRMEAIKLIYLVDQPGLTVDGAFMMNEPVEKIAEILESSPELIEPIMRARVRWAVKAVQVGVPRAHLIDGRLRDGLLAELFSKVGIGTMIHGNEYQRIRAATTEDVPGIYAITRGGVREEALRSRERDEIESKITEYFVYEIDGSLIGCASLSALTETDWELGGVFVQPFYQGKGVGGKLVAYAIEEAKRRGGQHLFALTTQNLAFFRDGHAFEETQATDLPDSRRQTLESSGRNSHVLVRGL